MKKDGWSIAVTEQVAHIYIDQVFPDGAGSEQNGADVLVLGCTHYPLLRPLLRRVVPHHVEIVDSAESTAARVVEILGKESGQGNPGNLRCYATDSVEKFRRLGGKFLGHQIENIELVDIEK